MTAAFGIIAAFAKQAIAVLYGKPWSWTDWTQDAIQNGFIAVVLSAIVGALQAQQRAGEARVQERLERDRAIHAHSEQVIGNASIMALAVSGWSQIPDETHVEPPPADADVTKKVPDEASQWKQICAEADKWKALATRIDRLRRRLKQPIGIDRPGMEVHSFFSTFRFEAATYMAEGCRSRRLLYARRLLDDLATIELSPDLALASAAKRVRYLSTALAGSAQHTDSTIAERLLVERRTPILTQEIPSGTLFTYTIADIPHYAVGLDSMYLLFMHIHEVLSVAVSKESSRKVDEKTMLLQFDLVNRILGALRNELMTASDYAIAIADLAQHALRVRATFSTR